MSLFRRSSDYRLPKRNTYLVDFANAVTDVVSLTENLKFAAWLLRRFREGHGGAHCAEVRQRQASRRLASSRLFVMSALLFRENRTKHDSTSAISNLSPSKVEMRESKYYWWFVKVAQWLIIGNTRVPCNMHCFLCKTTTHVVYSWYD